MKPLKLNFDLSCELMEDMNHADEYVEMKECYNNTFKAIKYIGESRDYDVNDFKVCYGFIDKMIGSDKDDRLYFRHAFLTYLKDNSVVDVTACLWDDLEEKYLDYNYYVFNEYYLDDYIDTLISESGLLALEKSNKINEVKMVNKLTEIGLTCNPIDFMNLIQNVYGNDFMKGINEYNKTQKIPVTL